jgi:hypothetical protein
MTKEKSLSIIFKNYFAIHKVEESIKSLLKLNFNQIGILIVILVIVSTITKFIYLFVSFPEQIPAISFSVHFLSVLSLKISRVENYWISLMLMNILILTYQFLQFMIFIFVNFFFMKIGKKKHNLACVTSIILYSGSLYFIIFPIPIISILAYIYAIVVFILSQNKIFKMSIISIIIIGFVSALLTKIITMSGNFFV